MLYLFNRLKKYIFLFLVLLLSGCTATYDVNINDSNDIIESLNITEDDISKFNESNELLHNATYSEYLNTNLNWPTPAYNKSETNPIEPKKIDGVEYYNKSNISTNKLLGINFKYKFKKNNYSESNIINSCFDIEYSIYGEKIFFKASNFKCFNEYPLLDNAAINLNTSCKVNEINSDYRDNQKYTWNIKKNEDKSILFSLDCKKIKKIDIPSTTIFPIYFLIVLLIILLLKVLYKLNNKI